jgi:hypothetical protein
MRVGKTRTSAQKVDELFFARSFAGALARSEGRIITNLRSNPEDPPALTPEGVLSLTFRPMERPPRLTTRMGQRLLSAMERTMRAFLPRYQSLGDNQIWRTVHVDHKTGFEFEVTLGRQVGNGIQLSVAVRPPFDAEPAVTILSARIAPKLRRYATPCMSTRLLVVDWGRHPWTITDLAFQEAHMAVASCPQRVFDEVWFLAPASSDVADVIWIWPADPFFAATVTGGRFGLRGLHAGDPWNWDRLERKADHEIGLYGERVRTRDALERVIDAGPDRPVGISWSVLHGPVREKRRSDARTIWIHESLKGEARHMWEQG